MARSKSIFHCLSCGHEEPKWMGRCPECGGWNTFTQTELPARAAGALLGSRSNDPVALDAIVLAAHTRFDSGLDEMNRVLGGGLMKGSSTLIGGEPGVGKSTLMLQIATQVQQAGKTLYVSGEESLAQIKLRAQRLKLHSSQLELVCETDVHQVLKILNSVKPQLIILDSIQTIISHDLGMVPGTVNQIKYCAQELVFWAKAMDASLLFIAHVTKEGTIAGPKIIEHMVDTVLYFEQVNADLRVLRAAKNRFGSVDEIGLFRMEERGLIQINNPSSLFMVQRAGDSPAGIAVVPVHEGSRVLLVEIQALVVPSKGGMSRVFSDKIDARRVSRIAAVLEKNLELNYSNQDIYVNVAGGIRLNEVGIELPLALSLYSARTGIPLSSRMVMVGELSLAAEILPVPHYRNRLKAAREMGFKNLLGPVYNHTDQQPEGFLLQAGDLKTAIKLAFKPLSVSGEYL